MTLTSTDSWHRGEFTLLTFWKQPFYLFFSSEDLCSSWSQKSHTGSCKDMLRKKKKVAGNLAGEETLKTWSRNYGNLNHSLYEMCSIFCQWHLEDQASPQQCCLAVRETILPFDLACVRWQPREHPHMCSLEHPNKRSTWTNWSESSGGHRGSAG